MGINPNPGVSPTPETPKFGPDKPQLGENEQAQPQKSFSLGPEGGQTQEVEASKSEQLSPMDLAREGGGQKPMAPEELSNQLQILKNQLAEAQTKIQDPEVQKTLSEAHQQALQRASEKMTGDVRTIAKNSEGEFNPPAHTSGESILDHITKWLNGSQQTMANALNFLSNPHQKPNPAQYLKLQYAVQRASQRGELFATIIGSSVSGIKTLMSTQLG